MRIIGRFLVFAISVLSAAILFSTVAKAQVLTDRYAFLELEVVDSGGKPVANAAVDSSGKAVADRMADLTRYQESGLITNQSGRLKNGLPVIVNKRFSPIGFSVFKTGYYTFVDYFEITRQRENWRNPIKLELLIVPKTDAERAAVGDEQIKRELFIAAKTGDAANVRKLLQAGLDPNLTTSDLRGVPGEKDVPVIVYAVSSGDGETVSELVRAGANVRKKDELTRGILAAYLNVDLYTLHYSRTEAEKAALRNAFETGAENLIKVGADVNYLNSDQVTTLMTAAHKGYVRTVRVLTEKGVPVNAKDEDGKTALMYAVNGSLDFASRLEMINLLLRSGADINAVTGDNGGDYYGCRTALIFAVDNGDPITVKLLIKNGATVNFACKGGTTALKIAKANFYGDMANKFREIIKLLKAAGAK